MILYCKCCRTELLEIYNCIDELKAICSQCGDLNMFNISKTDNNDYELPDDVILTVL